MYESHVWLRACSARSILFKVLAISHFCLQFWDPYGVGTWSKLACCDHTGTARRREIGMECATLQAVHSVDFAVGACALFTPAYCAYTPLRVSTKEPGISNPVNAARETSSWCFPLLPLVSGSICYGFHKMASKQKNFKECKGGRFICTVSSSRFHSDLDSNLGTSALTFPNPRFTALGPSLDESSYLNPPTPRNQALSGRRNFRSCCPLKLEIPFDGFTLYTFQGMTASNCWFAARESVDLGVSWN